MAKNGNGKVARVADGAMTLALSRSEQGLLRDHNDRIAQLKIEMANARLQIDELELRYRHSNVRPEEVVAAATLALAPGDGAEIRATVRALQARRAAAQPRKARTFGSVFKNPESGPGAGRMLEECGLKGHVIGGARISPVHANFIENLGDATSADVAALIVEARRRAHERFGVELEHEVELLGPIVLE
jgi:UDP-N-acetylmuramate dehydrogenase